MRIAHPLWGQVLQDQPKSGKQLHSTSTTHPLAHWDFSSKWSDLFTRVLAEGRHLGRAWQISYIHFMYLVVSARPTNQCQATYVQAKTLINVNTPTRCYNYLDGDLICSRMSSIESDTGLARSSWQVKVFFMSMPTYLDTYSSSGGCQEKFSVAVAVWKR